MFKNLQKVRVIPPTYIDVAKGGLLYRDNFCESDLEKDTLVMLGGLYKVRKQEKSNNKIWVELIEPKTHSHTVPDYFLVEEENFEACPFKVGDKVRFRPKCSEQDRQYLTAGDRIYSLNDPEKIYEIKDILNKYYIFLDCKRNEDISFPFRWVDFKKAN